MWQERKFLDSRKCFIALAIIVGELKQHKSGRLLMMMIPVECDVRMYKVCAFKKRQREGVCAVYTAKVQKKDIQQFLFDDYDAMQQLNSFF